MVTAADLAFPSIEAHSDGMKRLIAAVVLVAACAGTAAACQPQGAFCYNEPIVRNGHTVNQIKCVSPGFNPDR